MASAYPPEETIVAVIKWNLRIPMEHQELALALSVFQGRTKPIGRSRVFNIEKAAKKKIRAALEKGGT